MNAFNDDMYEDLIDLMNETAADATIGALVLTGSGPYFSSGADLKDANFKPEAGGRRTEQKPAGRFMMALINYPKVIAAAVQGPAVGIAVTLLMHCDIVHSAPTATYWAPFTRLALVPELCSSVTFRESMGLSKANELLLLGRKIDAETAMAWNICSSISPENGESVGNTGVAARLCTLLDENLLALPLGSRTASYFVDLIRHRKAMLSDVCRLELQRLDERFDSGQVELAASNLHIGSATGAKLRSHL